MSALGLNASGQVWNIRCDARDSWPKVWDRLGHQVCPRLLLNCCKGAEGSLTQISAVEWENNLCNCMFCQSGCNTLFFQLFVSIVLGKFL